MRKYYGAVVCENGHRLHALFQPGDVPDPRCGKCGTPTLTLCEECSAPLRGMMEAGGPNQSDHVKDHCWNCGKPYPWRKKQIKNGQKLLAVHFEIEDWDQATKDRLREIAGEIETNDASGEYIVAVGTWLEQRGGPAAKNLLWDLVKSMGTDAVKTYVQARFGVPL